MKLAMLHQERRNFAYGRNQGLLCAGTARSAVKEVDGWR